MKNLPMVALPEVEGDLGEAMAHYASWRSDGAAHVLGRYEKTVKEIGGNPESFPQRYGAVRRAILKRSYYIVYFIAETERVLVLAVLDGRRDPEEIRRMLKGRTGTRRGPAR
jgi:plasmid stabilization system protein ParE